MDNAQVSRTSNWEVLAAEANYVPRDLARLCHVSLRTLQRRFATNYGMTISDWMRQIRLAKAYARVVSGEPIKAVAYDLGFKQLSHFSRVFKEVHGVAPSLVSPRGRAKAALQNAGTPLTPPAPVTLIVMDDPTRTHMAPSHRVPINLANEPATMQRVAV